MLRRGGERGAERTKLSNHARSTNLTAGTPETPLRMFRMWGLARVVVLSAGAVTRTPSTDASTSSACAVFDKSASSAWGGVHETEYQKDNETPESITVDGNTYT